MVKPVYLDINQIKHDFSLHLNVGLLLFLFWTELLRKGQLPVVLFKLCWELTNFVWFFLAISDFFQDSWYDFLLKDVLSIFTPCLYQANIMKNVLLITSYDKIHLQHWWSNSMHCMLLGSPDYECQHYKMSYFSSLGIMKVHSIDSPNFFGMLSRLPDLQRSN